MSAGIARLGSLRSPFDASLFTEIDPPVEVESALAHASGTETLDLGARVAAWMPSRSARRSIDPSGLHVDMARVYWNLERFDDAVRGLPTSRSHTASFGQMRSPHTCESEPTQAPAATTIVHKPIKRAKLLRRARDQAKKHTH